MQKGIFFKISLILMIFAMFAVNTGISADDEKNDDKPVVSDDDAIKTLVTSYKDFVAKGDADNLMKILSADSVKLLENELNKLKKVLETLPPADINNNISSLGKSAKEILAMNVTDFLKWALSRLTDWDKEDLEKAELEAVIIAEDASAAELRWSKANINEAPVKAVKEDKTWKIVVTIS